VFSFILTSFLLVIEVHELTQTNEGVQSPDLIESGMRTGIGLLIKP